MIKLFNCPACGGDGVLTCNNPDHGFINGIGGETSRLGCPGCGSHPEHKVPGHDCDECGGCGLVTEERSEVISDEYGLDDVLEERTDLVKLHLVLKRQWFDMIDQEIKTEEYRDLKRYWSDRLLKRIMCDEFGGRLLNVDKGSIKVKPLDVIIFKHGYSKSPKTMIVGFKGLEVGKGKPEWGGSSDEVFILKLGTILHRNF